MKMLAGAVSIFSLVLFEALSLDLTRMTNPTLTVDSNSGLDHRGLLTVTPGVVTLVRLFPHLPPLGGRARC